MAIPRICKGPYITFLMILLYLSQLQLVLGASKKCFDGGGDQTFQLSCRPDSQADDICCEAGDICLSNGLCKYGPNAARNASIDVDTYQPGCTDQNWDAENCFSGCNNLKQPLVQNCYDNRYCCYGANGCNCSQTSLFELDAGTFVTTLPLRSATATGNLASNSATITITSSGPSTAAASPSSSSIESPSVSSSNLGVAVGVGVGVGLAVVIVGAISVFLFLRHKKKKVALPRENGTPYKGSMPLLEVDGHSAPQEVEYRQDPQELDGSEQMKFRHVQD